MLFSWPDSEGLLSRQEIKSSSVLIPQINEKHIASHSAVVHQLMMSLLGAVIKLATTGPKYSLNSILCLCKFTANGQG